MKEDEMAREDGKARARRTWGSSPTGSSAAGGAKPGTRNFFERALGFRSEYEQPWLPEVVPFHAMGGKRILEIGFGPGFDALTFMQSGAVYSGIDITPENVERTKKHLAFYGLSPDVQEGDAEALPFEDASFDVVYSNGVLHHVPSIETALAEVARVLRPGGSFYLIVYNRNSLFARVTSVIAALRHRRQIGERLSFIEYNAAGERPIVKVYSRSEVDSLLRGAGLLPVSLKVRKLVRGDLPGANQLEFLYRHIPQRVLDGIGRSYGWYIIAHAEKASDVPTSRQRNAYFFSLFRQQRRP